MRIRAAALAVALLAGVSSPALAVTPVPPPAPSPTSSALSPDAPDPHPPRGGLASDGSPVGGTRLLARGLVLPAGAPALPSRITARAWVVADLTSGTVVAARDPHGRYQPASIQKLLTTVTLLPLLPGARQVVVSRSAAGTEGSHAGLQAGHRYTVDQLFEGLLLVSGNDCAEALAQAAGGRAATVARMNATARALGASDTLVQTPSGLDGWQQLTSAYDMAVFLRAAVAQPRFLAYDRAATSRLPGTGTFYNQNELFLTSVRGALAAKTGFTDAAQHTFAGAIRRGGHTYGVVLMRAQRWPLDQWQQATELVRWARALPAGTPAVGTLPVTRRALASHPQLAPSRSPTSSPARVQASGPGSSGTSWPLWIAVAAAVLALGVALARRVRGA